MKSHENAGSLAIRKARFHRLRELSLPVEYSMGWYEERDNLARLYLWLEERGQAPDTWDFLTSPFRWDTEWQEMLQEHRNEAAK